MSLPALSFKRFLGPFISLVRVVIPVNLVSIVFAEVSIHSAFPKILVSSDTPLHSFDTVVG